VSKYLSSDNDPLYRFHQWQANLRILEVTQIKSIPYVPLSHPFVERLIAFGASIWITRCSGQLQISRRSCLISGPSSTTIARIPHGKGARQILPCHDQSPISARFDGNLTVDPRTLRFFNGEVHIGVTGSAAPNSSRRRDHLRRDVARSAPLLSLLRHWNC
jgi:hypothetical protein